MLLCQLSLMRGNRFFDYFFFFKKTPFIEIENESNGNKSIVDNGRDRAGQGGHSVRVKCTKSYLSKAVEKKTGK